MTDKIKGRKKYNTFQKEYKISIKRIQKKKTNWIIKREMVEFNFIYL